MTIYDLPELQNTDGGNGPVSSSTLVGPSMCWCCWLYREKRMVGIMTRMRMMTKKMRIWDIEEGEMLWQNTIILLFQVPKESIKYLNAMKLPTEEVYCVSFPNLWSYIDDTSTKACLTVTNHLSRISSQSQSNSTSIHRSTTTSVSND